MVSNHISEELKHHIPEKTRHKNCDIFDNCETNKWTISKKISPNSFDNVSNKSSLRKKSISIDVTPCSQMKSIDSPSWYRTSFSPKGSYFPNYNLSGKSTLNKHNNDNYFINNMMDIHTPNKTDLLQSPYN